MHACHTACMGKMPTRLAICVSALLLATGGHAQAQRCAAPLAPGAGVPAASINPVIVRVLGDSVTPVRATDGLVHLAYAAQVTNLASGVARISSIVPVDALGGFLPTGRNSVLDVHAGPITGQVRGFGLLPGDPRDASVLAAGGSGVTFFDVTYPSLDKVPERVAHLVSVRLPDEAVTATLTDPVRISCDGPVRLSPPLRGHGWWNGNGCCQTVNAHRSATLPVNGDLRPPEQFGIDYVQISPGGVCCDGPIREMRSWLFYGAPVLAAAAGTVVEAVDDQSDQLPGPPQGITPGTAGGNHVTEDIGDGRWVFYAHLRPGTVAVRPGETLRAGQQIGEVGNTGSSTAPHLHFQVMDRPSMLNAVGLPFVFDRQMLEGVVLGTAAQTELDYEAGRPLRIDRQVTGPREDEMPAEGQVSGFHLD